MKHFFRKVTLVSGVACGLFFISCQKEDPANAVRPTANQTGITQAPPLMTPDFKLSKNGNETLLYNADGRIKQVNGTADPIYVGYSTYRVEYEYSGNTIVATRYNDNVKESKKEWQLENGRAVKLIRTEYKPGGVTVLATSHLIYQYNGQDQLVKAILTGNEQSSVSLSYDNVGNVTKFLMVKNTKTGDEFINMVKYEYTEYVGGPLEADKGGTLHLHVFAPTTLGWIGDPYLHIFGNFGQSRLKKSIRENYPATYRYAYILDGNGYVKEQKTLKNNGTFIEGKQISYAIPIKNRI